MNESQDLDIKSVIHLCVHKNDVGSFGQTKIWIRGFDEQRLNVSVNNVPISDATKTCMVSIQSTKRYLNHFKYKGELVLHFMVLVILWFNSHKYEQPSKKEKLVKLENGDGDPNNIKLSEQSYRKYKVYFHYHKDYGYRRTTSRTICYYFDSEKWVDITLEVFMVYRFIHFTLW